MDISTKQKEELKDAVSLHRFAQKLSEQLQFIERSAEQYDRGFEIEAFRIATALRVLFHKTGKSTPLVTYLNMENCDLLSSTIVSVDHFGYVSFRINLSSPSPARAIPRLGHQLFPMKLPKWWNGQPVYLFAGRTYTRKDLVLAAANKDGGAHVDPHLDAFYEDMEKGMQSFVINAQNITYSGPAPFDQKETQYCRNLHVAMIRQFGHEVITSARHFQWLLALSKRFV